MRIVIILSLVWSAFANTCQSGWNCGLPCMSDRDCEESVYIPIISEPLPRRHCGYTTLDHLNIVRRISAIGCPINYITSHSPILTIIQADTLTQCQEFIPRGCVFVSFNDTECLIRCLPSIPHQCGSRTPTCYICDDGPAMGESCTQSNQPHINFGDGGCFNGAEFISWAPYVNHTCDFRRLDTLCEIYGDVTLDQDWCKATVRCHLVQAVPSIVSIPGRRDGDGVGTLGHDLNVCELIGGDTNRNVYRCMPNDVTCGTSINERVIEYNPHKVCRGTTTVCLNDISCHRPIQLPIRKNTPVPPKCVRSTLTKQLDMLTCVNTTVISVLTKDDCDTINRQPSNACVFTPPCTYNCTYREPLCYEVPLS